MLSDEDALIKKVLAVSLAPGPGVLGIGDDCAVIPWKSEFDLLVTTDAMIEGVHFRHDSSKGEDIGHKLLAVNLSDVAAMGGVPHSAFLSWALAPELLKGDWVDDFLRGFAALAQKYSTPILGGNTTVSRGPSMFSLTLLGKVERGRAKLRSTAKEGDILCVTGQLGDAGAGLKILDEKFFSPDLSRPWADLLRAQLQPKPHLEEGRWLSEQSDVHAMMDLSDGLVVDVKRLCQASHLGAEIDLDLLPVSHVHKHLAQMKGWDACDFSVASGEDYCLLAAVAPDAFTSVAQRFSATLGRTLFKVGRLRARGFTLIREGRPYLLKSRPFQHFTDSA